MITISWHFFLLMVAIMLSFCYVLTRKGKGKYGDFRELAVVAWGFVWLIILAIYGGFVWW